MGSTYVLVVLNVIFLFAQALQPIGRLLTPEEGCGISKVANTKIVGGSEAKPGEYPWMVLIYYTDAYGEKVAGCGGSLITSRHVLTAAHCIMRELTEVKLGVHDLRATDEKHNVVTVKVVQAYVFPKFGDGFQLANDVAILALEFHVKFKDHIRPICLPFSKELRKKSFVDQSPFIAGWGAMNENGTTSNVLMHTQIQVIKNEQCKELYKVQNALVSAKQFDNTVVCAGALDGGKDACGGDSGGPLMLPILENGQFAMYQIGLVSDGLGCAQENSPGFYTSVQYFIDWIQYAIQLKVKKRF